MGKAPLIINNNFLVNSDGNISNTNDTRAFSDNITFSGDISGIDIEELDNVTVTSPLDGELLVYDNGIWVNDVVSGVSGVTNITQLDDVTITTPSNDEVLTYDNGTWVNAVAASSTWVGTATSDLDMSGNDITDSTGALQLGDSVAGTPPAAYQTIGDVNINADLYVAGSSYLDEDLSLNAVLSIKGYPHYIKLEDGSILQLGSSVNDGKLGIRTAQDPDTLVFELPSTSNNIVFCEVDDFNGDFDHGPDTNPTIYVQSAVKTSGEQFISFAHDQTDAVITSGAGDIKLAAESGLVKVSTPWEKKIPIYPSQAITSEGSATINALTNEFVTAFFSSTSTQNCHLSSVISSNWTENSDITLRFYWSNTNESAIQLNDNVKFDIEWKSISLYTTSGESLFDGTPATDSVTYTETNDPGIDGETHISTITLSRNDANQPIHAGDILGIRFSYDHNSSYGNPVHVIFWEICYDIDIINHEYS